MSEAIVSARPECLDCRRPFPLFSELVGRYRARGLDPPRRCPLCRRKRRERRVEMRGTVEAIGAGFGFIRGEDRRGYFFGRGCVAGSLPLRRGDRVRFTVDPAVPVLPGRRPLALRVWADAAPPTT